MQQHTAGQWEYNEMAMIMAGNDPLRVPVAAVFDKHWRNMPAKETREANGRLIAEAPTLLHILEILVEQNYHPHMSTLCAARDAIERIKGTITAESLAIEALQP